MTMEQFDMVLTWRMRLRICISWGCSWSSCTWRHLCCLDCKQTRS